MPALTLLTRRQAASVLGFPLATVIRFFEERGLHPVVRGGETFYRVEDVRALARTLDVLIPPRLP